MSHSAVNWAYDQELPLSEKFLLVTLADYADGNDWCFPGQVLLAKRISASDRTVRSLLAKLAERGLISIQERRSQGGYRTSNGYQLVRLSAPPEESSGSGISPEVDDTPTGNSRQSYRKTASGTENRKREPSDRTVRSNYAPEVLDVLFETAWASWPKKADRKGARATFEKVIVKGIWTDDDSALMSIIARFGQAYRDTTDVKFVPHLTTWLNREGWNDELPVLTANQPWNAPPKNMSAAERRRATLHDAIAQAREMDAQRAAQNLSAGELNR